MNDSVRFQIERYLDGGMTPREASEFLATVEQDPEALALLGRALEDQAHLFDVIRGAVPAEKRRDTTRRLQIRRLRARSKPRSGLYAVWIAGLAAAGMFTLWLAPPAWESRSRVRSPRPAPDVSVAPSVPPSEPLPEASAKRLQSVAEAPTPPPSPNVPSPPRIETPVAPRREEPPPPPPEPPLPGLAPSRNPATLTRAAVAILERVQGDCLVLDGTEKLPATSNGPLLSGQGLQCGPDSAAVVKFQDHSRVELGPATRLRECIQGPGGRQLRIDTGTLIAEVAKQKPAESFAMTTGQAEIVVIGTRFSVACAPDSTRVDVREGRVRVTRLSDGATTEVPANHSVVIAAGAPVEARPSPIDEILLVPAQGRILGTDWHPEKDAEASTGIALEAPKSHPGPLQDANCVAFTTNAEAGKTYYVWVRGKCMAKTNRIEHDAVIIDFGDSEVTEPPGPNKGLTGGLERGLFNGFMHTSGYGWVGSDSDQGRDVPCVTVRFSRPGRQTVKLYVREGPIRIDSIWISALQKSRPDDSQSGPLPPRK
jgi:ferric-dicitrate binding protein FerR (iron transport regulator)